MVIPKSLKESSNFLRLFWLNKINGLKLISILFLFYSYYIFYVKLTNRP